MQPAPLALRISINVLLMLVPLNVCALAVTEVLPNPIGDDNNKEYVEFLIAVPFLPTATLVFSDGDGNDTLQHSVTFDGESAPDTLLLIVEEGHNLSLLSESFLRAAENVRCIVFSAGATIGNNLENAGDELLLWADGILVVNESYAVAAGSCADGLGCSLANDGEGWRAANATPCLPNIPVIAGSNLTNGSDAPLNVTMPGGSNGTSTTNASLNLSLNVTSDPIGTNVTLNETTNGTFNGSTDAMNLSTNLSMNLSINLSLNLTSNISADVPMNSSSGTLNPNETNNTLPGTLNLTNASGGFSTNLSLNLSTNHSANTTANLTNATSNASAAPCAYTFGLWASADHLGEGSPLSFQPQLAVENISLSHLTYSFAYWIEAAGGGLVRERTTTTNTNKKSFTPRCAHEECEYTLTVQLSSLSCAPEASATREWVFTAQGTPSPATAAAQPVKVAAKAAAAPTIDVLAEQDTLSAVAPLVVDGAFVVNVTLWNDGYADALFVVWAYLYRTSQNYSAKDATRELIVPPREETVLELPIDARVPAPGDYKIKVRALAPWRTTPYEVTLPITFVENAIDHDDVPDAYIGANVVAANLSTQSVTGVRSATGNVVAAVLVRSSLKRFVVAQGAWLSVALVAILWGASALLKRRRPPEKGPGVSIPSPPPNTTCLSRSVAAPGLHPSSETRNRRRS